jgi:hypothetical protein
MDLVMEPSEHVVYEGVLADLAVGELNSGECREVETALCFLAHGRFEISAEVRAFQPSRVESRAGVGQLVAIVRGIDT